MIPSDQVLWTLDNGIQPFDFERLCVDLLCRYGYRHIVPIGGIHDHGRDAELRCWKGDGNGSSLVVFQFSLQKSWEAKLRSDAVKIAKFCEGAAQMVFVTSQNVTGAKQDQLKREYKSTYNWDISIYAREWLRHKLTQFDQDLAKEYLGLDLPPTIGQTLTKIDLTVISDENFNEIFQHSSPELARASIVESTRKEPSIAGNWYRLAQVDYLLRNYSSSLEAVNAALHRLDAQDRVAELNITNFKGAVLAEMGIQNKSRALLIHAKEIFIYAAEKLKRAQDFYNLANVLEALDENEEAEKNYNIGLELKPDHAQAWKNLGSLLAKTEQREKAMECFGKALKYNPNLVEAHLSMATTYLLFFDSPKESVECFERAFALMPDLDRKWKYTRYWYSKALHLIERDDQALSELERELSVRPDDLYLLNLKANILSHLRTKSSVYEQKALKFLKFRAEAIPKDFQGLNEIIQIYKKQGSPEEAWPWIDANLKCSPIPLSQVAKQSELSASDFQCGFLNFKLYRTFRKRYSLEEHCEALFKHGLIPNQKVLPVLNYALLAPFGLLGANMSLESTRRNKQVLDALFLEALSMMTRIFPSLGVHWLAKDRPNDRDGQIDLLARGMIHLCDNVIIELSRHVGFLSGTFGIPDELVPMGASVDWEDVRAEINVRLLEQVTRGWEIQSGPVAPPA